MLVKDVIDFLDNYAPLKYSEDFDNTGLIVGDKSTNVNGIIICLDSTKEVVQEARRGGNIKSRRKIRRR